MLSYLYRQFSINFERKDSHCFRVQYSRKKPTPAPVPTTPPKVPIQLQHPLADPFQVLADTVRNTLTLSKVVRRINESMRRCFQNLIFH